MERFPDPVSRKIAVKSEPEIALTFLGSTDSCLRPNRMIQKWTDGSRIVYFPMPATEPLSPEEITGTAFELIATSSQVQKKAFEALPYEERLAIEHGSITKRGRLDNPALRYLIYFGQRRLAVEFAESIQAQVGVHVTYH